MPQERETVEYIDITRYSGLWYEIARFPKWFERKMTNVTAEYIPEDGFIRVINSGMKKGKKKVVRGKAYIVENSGNAILKVSFFPPFKGDYRIIDIDDDYKWAVVSDKRKSSLWILSRTPKLETETLKMILDRLYKRGYDLHKVEFTEQN